MVVGRADDLCLTTRSPSEGSTSVRFLFPSGTVPTLSWSLAPQPSRVSGRTLLVTQSTHGSDEGYSVTDPDRGRDPRSQVFVSVRGDCGLDPVGSIRGWTSLSV